MCSRVESRVQRSYCNKYVVDLSKKQLSDEDMEMVVAKILLRNQCTELILKENNITEKGAFKLAQGLKTNISLEKLDLGKNNIRDQGVRYLVDALVTSNKTLTKLHLQSNGITEVGAGYLAEMLTRNLAICRLGLDYNNIGDGGTRLLSDALRSNSIGQHRSPSHEACDSAVRNRGSPLRALFLDENNIGDDGVTSLAEMLQVNQEITGLALGRNKITDLGAQKLIEAVIKKKGGVSGLNLFSNKQITDRSVDIFLRLFEEKRKFKMYKLYDCGFSSDGVNALQMAAKRIPGFVLLIVDGDGFDYGRQNPSRSMRQQPDSTKPTFEDWSNGRKQMKSISRNTQRSYNSCASAPKEKSVTDVKCEPTCHEEAAVEPVAHNRASANSDDPVSHCETYLQRLTISSDPSTTSSLLNPTVSISPPTKNNNDSKANDEGSVEGADGIASAVNAT